MLNLDKIVDLPQEKVADLTDIIAEKRAGLKDVGLYVNDIVREDIFDILANYCTVVYFPLPDEENDGFHITMPVDYKEGGAQEHFVFLNTEKPLEKQVFAAAHELGHIWVSENEFWSGGLEETLPRNRDHVEAVMNRFAAELLMPEEWFGKSADEQLRKYEKADHRIFLADAFRVVASLMDEFCVPAQAVICRFYETKLLKKEACQQLLTGPVGKIEPQVYHHFFDFMVEQCVKEGGYTKLLKSTRRKGIKDFPVVLTEVERSGLFSPQKVEKLREMLGIPTIEEHAEEMIDMGEEN